MIRKLKGEPVTFVLDTERTTYAFSVAASGHLEHLYYGAKIPVKTTYELAGIRERHEFELGNVIVYSPAHKNVFLEDMMQEAGTLGHGDVREPMIEAVMPDGSRSLNFLYQNYILDDIPPVFNDLPHSYSEKGRVEHLAVNLSDRDLSLTLHYCVYPKCDVITRSAVLTNNGKGTAERSARFARLRLQRDLVSGSMGKRNEQNHNTSSGGKNHRRIARRGVLEPCKPVFYGAPS